MSEMNDLKRKLAPVADDAWNEIETEAKRTLRLTLAGRRAVDFVGPLGYAASSVALGRTAKVAGPAIEGVEIRRRQVLPLIELRTGFDLSLAELDDISRGAVDADLGAVTEAARRIALAEDQVIFEGCESVGIEGILSAAAGNALPMPADAGAWPRALAGALNALHSSAVEGPFALLLGTAEYTALMTAVSDSGRRVIDHVTRLIDGGVHRAEALSGALLLSTRGGDFELHVGRDFSIGYAGHNAENVSLYLQETLSFRVPGPEAAIPFRPA